MDFLCYEVHLHQLYSHSSDLTHLHKVGVASFISQLVQKVGVSIKPFTSMLLRLLFLMAKEERSGASKRAFANSCAFVLKYAAPSQVQKLIEESCFACR